MLEVVVRKNNVKPLKQFLSSHDRELILPIVTTAQLSLAEFCLSFKEKLTLISCKKEELRRYSRFNFLCSFVTRNFKNIFIFLDSE